MLGESGCGKSVSCLSIMKLIPSPPGKIVSGQVEFSGRNILELNEAEIREIRGSKISMIFQDPMTSLNPFLRISTQMTETISLHQSTDKKQSLEKAVEMLRMVGIPHPEKRIYNYPHQFSGGMRQRVMIAMALSCHPEILIADEPTTALDVTIQAQILDIIKGLTHKTDTSVILITHDLGVVAGDVPSPDTEQHGCYFYSRCPDAMPHICKDNIPPLTEIKKDHYAACFLYFKP